MTFTNFPIDEDKFYEAVKEGVENAIYRAIKDGIASTARPADLIFQALKEGTRDAMDKR